MLLYPESSLFVRKPDCILDIRTEKHIRESYRISNNILSIFLQTCVINIDIDLKDKNRIIWSKKYVNFQQNELKRTTALNDEI